MDKLALRQGDVAEFLEKENANIADELHVFEWTNGFRLRIVVQNSAEKGFERLILLPVCGRVQMAVQPHKQKIRRNFGQIGEIHLQRQKKMRLVGFAKRVNNISLKHEYYTFLYNQAVFNMLKEKRGEKEAMIFGRSCTVGSQRFPVQWGGDNHSSYVSMAETLRGGLSFCQSGFGFWAHDISGFNDTATPDLYKRWTAFGMLSTHSRLHGSQTPRMPWYFDDESGKVLSHFAKLKCSLMPYIYANTVRVHLEGQPEMRAMMLDFPKDRNCLYLDRQYMLGDSLLVAPIFNDRGDVDFYVPEGRWTDLLTGRVYSGGQWYSENCDYYHLPLLVKPNSIIPMGENSRTVYDYADGAEYAVYQLEDGRSTERRVYDANGEEATCMTICRRGNKLHVSMEGRDAAKPWKLRLKGIMSVQTTAKVEICEDGAVIMPAAGTTEPEIHL